MLVLVCVIADIRISKNEVATLDVKVSNISSMHCIYDQQGIDVEQQAGGDLLHRESGGGGGRGAAGGDWR